MLLSGRQALLTTPRRTRLLLLLALVALLSLTAALLDAALGAPPPWTLDIGAPGDARFLGSFYQSESTGETRFRWSAAGAQLALHGADVVPLRITLRIHGAAATADRGNRLLVQRDGQTFANVPTEPRWRLHHLMIPAGARWETAPLELVSSRYQGNPNDGRSVGVALDSVDVWPLTKAPLWAGAPLWRALVLVWGLAVLAGLLYQLDRALFGASRRRAGLYLLLLGVLALGLVLWARRNPYTLAWALPPTPWTLGLLTTGLLLGTLGSRRPSPDRSAGTDAPRRPVAGVVTSIALASLLVAQILFWSRFSIGSGIVLVIVGTVLLVLVGGTDQKTAHERCAPDGELVPALGGRWACWSWKVGLGLIFLVALGLRFYRIAGLPYGLWRDEARHGLVALDILQNARYRPIYVDAVDLPALGLYPFVFALKLWGAQVWSMRSITALAGSLTVLPLYGLARRLTGRRSVALLAAALLAVSSWHISISRLSWPIVFDPLLSLTGLWLLMRALDPAHDQGDLRFARRIRASRRTVSAGSALLAGVCFGLALQTYHTGRLAPLIGAMLGLLILFHAPGNWRRSLAGVGLCTAGFIVVAAPLLYYAMSRPESFNGRVNAVSLLAQAERHGRAPLSALDEAAGRHALMFNVHGDDNGRHHAPGRPLLDFVTGLGLLVGCASLFRRWRDWRYAFLLAGGLMGVLPSLVAVEGPHALRGVDSLGFVCIIAALGWADVWGHVGAATNPTAAPAWRATRTRSMWTSYSLLGASLLVGLALALNFHTYFISMPSNPNVWQSFYPIQTQVGVYLRRFGEAHGRSALEHVYISKSLANHSVLDFLDDDLPVQTFDGTTLSRPPQPGALFVLSGYTYAQDARLLAAYLGPTPTPVLHGPLLPDGLRPSFVVYRTP